ncbi:hypothetical protein QBC32DRAFT_343159 [Pseudoneurospora amorphoporcata]|uniref:Mitochondrial distribution and morphology protein 12 n=1 Tax=Pseudoneurospora amorphoporcata TaxID=241081 RepID=A0AAN6NTI9_9PEZI|nr:hypothetical protein QBC32DRAFT_343159 [Pseudoneurospora amorphoporcata]
MSIDLNWETVTGGPDGQELAHKIRDFIHNKFQDVPLPRFIKSVTVHDFEFGSIPPEIELKDITDPLPDFYEEQPGIDSSDESDSEEDIAYENEGEYLDDPVEQQYGRVRGASASESRRRLTVNSNGTGSGRTSGGNGNGNWGGSGPNSGRVAYLPPHLNPHYPGSGNNSSQSLDRDNGRDGRYYRDANNTTGGLGGQAGPAHGTNHHHADLGSPFLGVSTPGIPGGTSNLNLHYFTSQFTGGLSGTQTPLAAVAGAAHQRGPSWITEQQQNNMLPGGFGGARTAAANQGLHSSSTPNLRLHFPGVGKHGGGAPGHGPSPLTGTSTPLGTLGTAGGVGGIGRGIPGMAGMGSMGMGYPPAPVLAIPTGPRHTRNPSSQSSNSVGDYSPVAPAEKGGRALFSPPSVSPSPGVGLGIGRGSAAALTSGPRLQIPTQGLREKHSVSTLAPNSAGPRAGSAILDDDDGFMDGSMHDRDLIQQLDVDAEKDEEEGEEEEEEEGQRFREPRVEDIQAVFRIKYAGDVKLLLTADILLDYPMPSFVGIPVRLSITGLTFDGVGVVANIRKRVHFCFLSPEDAVAAVGGEENKVAAAGSGGNGSGMGGGGGSDGAKTKMGGLLQEIRVESEIGQRESGKQSLKNVGKVERFVLEQVRRIFEEEFVYPSFWTFLV